MPRHNCMIKFNYLTSGSKVKITVTSGDRSKGDCRHKAYVNPGKYKKPSTVSISDDLFSGFSLFS